jgi:tetratricopeptide (TPR) repeat protein
MWETMKGHKAPEEHSPTGLPPREHRALVRQVYRRLDWLTHYELLGTTPKASGGEIREAYRLRASLFDPAWRAHPELAECRRELATLSARVRAAFDILSDRQARARYDAQLRDEHLARMGVDPPSGEARRQARRELAAASYKKAQELASRRDFSPAVEMLDQAVQLDPANAQYLFLLATIELKNRFWRQSGIEHLEQAAKLAPGRPEIAAALAEVYREAGRLSEAVSEARRALDLEPGSENYRILLYRIEHGAAPSPAGEPAEKTRKGR